MILILYKTFIIYIELNSLLKSKIEIWLLCDLLILLKTNDISRGEIEELRIPFFFK